MDDNTVKKLCADKVDGKVGKMVLKKLLKEQPELEKYLKERYHDSDSVHESINRILNNFEKKPRCKVCGKILEFNAAAPLGFRTYCSSKCQNSDPEKIALTDRIKLEKYGDAKYNNAQKAKQTCIEKYGVEYVTQTNEFKEKSKRSCFERYGVEYALQSEEIKNKGRQTCLEKYGVDNSMKCEAVKEKAKQTCFEHFGVYNSKQSEIVKQKERNTCLERYGVTSYRKTKECEEKIRATVREKYGVDHVTKSKEWTDKWYSNKEWVDHKINSLYKSMKENASFPMTKSEYNLKNFLENNYDNVICNYKDERYPFKCDFYLKDKDLFIEYNGHWTHGGHFFNPENKNDVIKLEKWRSKNTKFYDNAINTWTVRDVQKIETAKKNKIKYLVLWPTDIKDLNKIKTMIDEF